MSKKLSELLRGIDPKEIENIRIEDENDEAVNEKVKEVSLERIKALAMNNVQETKVVSIDKPIRRRKKTVSKFIIPLVAAASLSLGTVAATQNETLSHLFGQLFPYKDQVQSIDESMSASGLIFTAEGAFIDEKTGMFVASFRKEDGSDFKEGTEVGSMSLEMEKPNAMGWSITNQLSDDKKQLDCIVELSSSKKLHGQELILKAENLKVWHQAEILAPVKLSEIKEAPIEGNWKNYNSVDGLEEKLTDEGTNISLDRLAISDKGLEIITSYPDKAGIQDQILNLYLINTQTGETIEETESEHYWSKEEGLNKDYVQFKGVSHEDLKSLQLKVCTSYYEEAVQGNWEVGFELDENKQVIKKSVGQMVEAGKGKFYIKKVQVSALGVTIQGRKFTGQIEDIHEAYLEMKDGSKLHLQTNGMNSSISGVNIYMKAGNVMQENQDAAFVAEEDYTGITLGAESFNGGVFIDINEVQSIVINGKCISLV